MKITMKSIGNSKETTMDLPITADQLAQWEGGQGLMQNIFPNLTAYQRDWLKYGYTQEEWEVMYGKEDGDAEPPQLMNKLDAITTLEYAFAHNKEFKQKWRYFIEISIIQAFEQTAPHVGGNAMKLVATSACESILELFETALWEAQGLK